ncbi:MAG: site-specific integrase, partial [Pseudomonadota bacterium]
MPKRNANNERIKRKYLIYLTRAEGKSEATVDMAAAAIDRFMQANNHKCLKRFHINQATAFRDKFESQSHPKTGEPL